MYNLHPHTIIIGCLGKLLYKIKIDNIVFQNHIKRPNRLVHSTENKSGGIKISLGNKGTLMENKVTNKLTGVIEIWSSSIYQTTKVR